jgi:hypothetical protein
LSRRSRKKSAPPQPRRPPDPVAPPTLYELERFSADDLDRWAAASERLDELQRELHFGLESQRLAHRDALLTALRGAAAPALPLDRWFRLVDYQYSLEPLSPKGSGTAPFPWTVSCFCLVLFSSCSLPASGSTGWLVRTVDYAPDIKA